MVTEKSITDSLKELGIKEDDTVIVHSSLKSFGKVDGGAETVISAFKKVLEKGTLCFPALSFRDFKNAYKTWDINNTPSDVGLISETFRKSEGVLRSNQATHSVCAYGKNAEFITKGHSTGKGRIGIYGTTPFSYESPWQKIYGLNGKVVMLGVTMVYNTFKHFLEYSFVNDIISSLPEREKDVAASRITSWKDVENCKPGGDPDKKPDGIWFWHDGLKTQREMEKAGLVKHTLCGESELICFNVKDFYNFMYKQFSENPDAWFDGAAADWVKKYLKRKYNYKIFKEKIK